MIHDPADDGRAPRQPDASIHSFPIHRPKPAREVHKPNARTGPAGGRNSFAYLAFWVLLASGAGLYLLALHQGYTGFGPLGSPSVTKEAPPEPNAEVEKLTRQLSLTSQSQQDLADHLAATQGNITDLQQQVNALAQANQILAARLSATEKGKPLSKQALADLVKKINANGAGFSAESSSLAEAPTQAVATAEPEQPKTEGTIIDAMAEPTSAPAQPKDASRVSSAAGQDADMDGIPEAAPASDEASMETGTTAPAPAEEATVSQPVALTPPPKKATAAAAPAAPAKIYGVELATATAPEALRLNWELLVEKHTDVLQGLTPLAADSADPSDENKHLVAGPFTTAAAAKSFCKKLATLDVACRSAVFAGNPL